MINNKPSIFGTRKQSKTDFFPLQKNSKINDFHIAQQQQHQDSENEGEPQTNSNKQQNNDVIDEDFMMYQKQKQQEKDELLRKQQLKKKQKKKYKLAKKLQQEFIPVNEQISEDEDEDGEYNNLDDSYMNNSYMHESFNKTKSSFLGIGGGNRDSNIKQQKRKLQPVNIQMVKEMQQRNMFTQLKKEKYKRVDLGPTLDKQGKVIPYSVVGKVQQYADFKEKMDNQQRIQKMRKQSAIGTTMFQKKLLSLGQKKNQTPQHKTQSQQQQQSKPVESFSKSGFSKKAQQNTLLNLTANLFGKSNNPTRQPSASKQSGVSSTKILQNPGLLMDPTIEYMTKQELIDKASEMENRRKHIEEIEHEYINNLPIENQNEMLREEKILQKHQKTMAKWDAQQHYIHNKVNKSVHQSTLMEQNHLYRQRVERSEIMEILKPVDQKLGSRYWHMSLRSDKDPNKIMLKEITNKHSLKYYDQPELWSTEEKNIMDITAQFGSMISLDANKQVEQIRNPDLLFRNTSQQHINSLQNSQSNLMNHHNSSTNHKKSSSMLQSNLEKLYQTSTYLNPNFSTSQKGKFINSTQNNSIMNPFATNRPFHSKHVSLPSLTTFHNPNTSVQAKMAIQFDDEEDLVIKGNNKLKLEIDEIKNDGRPINAIYKKKKIKPAQLYDTYQENKDQNQKDSQKNNVDNSNNTNNNNNKNMENSMVKSNPSQQNSNNMGQSQGYKQQKSSISNNNKVNVNNIQTQQQQQPNQPKQKSPQYQKIQQQDQQKLKQQDEIIINKDGLEQDEDDDLEDDDLQGKFYYRKQKIKPVGEVIAQNYDRTILHDKIYNQQQHYLYHSYVKEQEKKQEEKEKEEQLQLEMSKKLNKKKTFLTKK